MPIKVQRLLSPEDWREKQLTTLKAVGRRNYEKRIASPKKDPIEAGIAAEDRYAEAMRQVIEQKRRAAGLKFTNSDEWYTYAKTIGAERLVDGVVKREPKVKRFIDNFHPLLAEHLAKIDPMPTTTLKDRIDKAVANIEGLAALKGAYKKGTK